MFELERPIGFNVIGHVSGDFGLGVAARNTIKLLLELGYPVAVVDVRGGGGEIGQDRTYADLELPKGKALPYAVTLFHMNPVEIRVLLQNRPRWFAGGETLNVAVPYWELPRIPDPWVPILSGMDAILAPTTFIGDAVRAALPDIPIIHFPQAVQLPEGIAGDRSRFGIPEDAFAVFTTFHTGSGIARKNPMAAVRAFTDAFGKREDAILVVKMTVANPANPLSKRQHLRDVAAIKDIVCGAGRTIIIEGSLPYREVLTLYASCDSLLSLHRSEGLGLHLMEAMALGQVVVATGWSGNMDFMTETNSIPIPYELRPVEEAQPVERVYTAAYVGHELKWAEPDVPAASRALLSLAGSPERRALTGAEARHDMLVMHNAYLKGTAFSEVVRMADQGLERSRSSARQLASNWHISLELMAKRIAKRLLGRI